jgi:FAD/FMN-containing dehydrogenase
MSINIELSGVVLTPEDAGYPDVIRPWNGLVDKRPALVVQPASAPEVAAVIRQAAARGLPLSVRGGGHHIAGTSLVDGGLTIDLSRLTAVEVDPVARTATVGAGCRLKDVDRETQRHGLAVPLGFISNVGVGGLTLGGGLGYLTRRFGWTVDNLLEVEIVTADGTVRRASRDVNPDLFWGVRGAGANLGVVTRFTFQLHPVGPLVHGGLIAWSFDRAPEIMAAYRQITAEAPRELAAWLVLLHAPPAPFVPVDWHGRKLCGMAVCYSGDPANAEAVLAPIRALGEPVFDLVGEMPYTAVQSYLDDTEPAGMCYYWRTEYVAALDEQLLDTLRDVFQACTNPMADVGILHLAGAINERAEDDGAVGNRDARFVIGVKGMWAAGDPDEDRFQDWVRTGGERVHPFGTGRTYVNFQSADEPDARVRASYGTNYARLAALKHRYDPGNLFRSNRNITPAEAPIG